MTIDDTPEVEPDPRPADAPDDPTFDDEPMTEDQIGQLKALCLQVGDPQAFSTSLTRAEADGRIRMLEAAIAR